MRCRFPAIRVVFTHASAFAKCGRRGRAAGHVIADAACALVIPEISRLLRRLPRAGLLQRRGVQDRGGRTIGIRRPRLAPCGDLSAAIVRKAATALVVSCLMAGFASAAKLQVQALGGTLEVFEIPDGALTSVAGEDRATFLKRVGAALHDYTRSTGFEACTRIWTKGEFLAVRSTSNRAHVGCVTTDLAPSGDGWTADVDGIHSHPIHPYYRTNEADVLFQGHVAPVGVRAHTDGTNFSPRDFGSSRGYLVNSEGHLLHQHGRGTVQDLGPVNHPGAG